MAFESDCSDDAEDATAHAIDAPPSSELQFDNVSVPAMSFPLPGGGEDVEMFVSEGMTMILCIIIIYTPPI